MWAECQGELQHLGVLVAEEGLLQLRPMTDETAYACLYCASALTCPACCSSCAAPAMEKVDWLQQRVRLQAGLKKKEKEK